MPIYHNFRAGAFLPVCKGGPFHRQELIPSFYRGKGFSVRVPCKAVLIAVAEELPGRFVGARLQGPEMAPFDSFPKNR